MSGARHKIILVDDNMTNLTMGKNLLSTFFAVYPVSSAKKLFEILNEVTPDIILLDIAMPEMDGYETIKKLKADSRYSDIPVIFLTAKGDERSELEGFNLGAVDYVSKPFSGPLLIKRIENQLLIIRQKTDLLDNKSALEDYANNLEEKVREKTKEIINLQNTVLATLADLVEMRDKLTGGHILRTKLYMKALVEELISRGIYSDETAKWDMDFLLPSVQLHDIGKIAISDLILNKQGPLTREEFDIMKTHVIAGVDALEKIISITGNNGFLHHAIYITGTHHEKWDGTGYPTGLSGKNIPLEGRLMAIADVYDALISERPYKKPMPHAQANDIIEGGMGTHFDPALLDVYRAAAHTFEQIAGASRQ